ncbi:MAG: PSD1 and planctomycete cytochrome C domain-containing protein, partial [Planctomycetota bacterium]
MSALRLLALVAAAFAAAPTAAQRAPSYTREVRPILSEHCFACHGPDDAAREADLRLDAPGHGRGTELLRRISSTDRDEVMPPPHTGKTLSREQAATLRAWVLTGAPYETHWAFVKPARPPLPDAASDSAHPIDRFVRAQLSARGIPPAPEADRLTLARRLYLDLTGLPPTPAQADAFAADGRPDAYERLVDRLLASEAYAERQARRWLDLARYADSNGYEKDRARSIWPYRDWVIRAFEAHMPYDDFVVRQLAGDMLPDATPEDRIATGFHRNTMLNEEGGIDPLEFRFHALTDRVATTGAVFLGMTIGCAQCHTHKYDPITHREYFGLMAYLDDADEPDYVVPDEAADARMRANRARAGEQLDELWTSWPGGDETRDARFAAWLTARRSGAVSWTPAPLDSATANLPTLTLGAAPGLVVASGDTTKQDTYRLTFRATTAVRALRLEALPHDSLPAGGPGLTYYEGRKGDFFLAELSLRVQGAADALPFARATQSFAKNQYGRHAADAEAAIDGDLQTGWSTHTRNGERHVAVFELREPAPPGAALALELRFGRHFASSLGRFRISTTAAPDAAATALAFDDDGRVEALLQVADGDLTEPQRRALRDAFLFDAEEVRERADKIRRLRARREHATTLVLRERPAHLGRETRRRHRGEFLQPREAVPPHLPAALGATRRVADRLNLARWLVSADNPLAGRVLVNREWAALFGRGLVETPADFGARGAAPSHPQLLDWLAVEVVESGWDLQHLQRLIVTSATYRQRAAVDAEARAADPENRWLGRSPRLRLDAEVVRDAALVAAGKLSPRRFGRPVRPPQPAGVTEISFGRPGWRADRGEARFRRSIYTFQKRTAPFAFYATFDAPSGE